jgi:sulfate adenylyltransferase subunit 2
MQSTVNRNVEPESALGMSERRTHLRELESESIYIMREVAESFERPVMLYSIGKDSSVMLHLARKAFFPDKPPFPLMHIDSTWEFHCFYK